MDYPKGPDKDPKCRIPKYLRDVRFWLRGSALIANIAITVLWGMFGELPTLCGEQTMVFLHVIPSYNLILLALTVVPFLEPLEAFVHRILCLTGACLFALAGTIGVINYIAIGEFQVLPLNIFDESVSYSC